MTEAAGIHVWAANVGAGLQRALWGVLVLGALYLVVNGFGGTLYVEPTREALAAARLGSAHLYEGALLLLVATGWALLLGPRRWAAMWLGAAGLLCGGVAAGLPWLAVIIAVPLVLIGLVGGLPPKLETAGSPGSRAVPTAVAALVTLAAVGMVLYATSTLGPTLHS